MIQIKNKLLNPKIDYVFKRIFGYSGNEDITKNFLSSIISDSITEIKLNCNPITEKDLFDDKIGILDIKAKINNNINCNIEMQIVDNNNIEKRLLFYWSKMYTSSIKTGNKYEDLEKCIVILIADYNLDNLKAFPEYLTKWNIREEKYSKFILTDVMEVYIIELRKFKEALKKDSNILNAWLQFINNPEVESKMENKEIKKAKKVLEEISQDEREQYLSELRQKYIMDQNAIHSHGYDKGFEEGVQQSKIEIVKKMLSENLDFKTIIKITGLTEEEINKIIKNI